MMRLSLILLLSLGACRADETLSGYGASETSWTLQSIDGKSFSAKATITFPQEGSVAGKAPCNNYSGTQTAPYPWFEAKQIVSTKRACQDLDQETRFFKALSEMTISEVSATTLILSNEAKRSMVFKAN